MDSPREPPYVSPRFCWTIFHTEHCSVWNIVQYCPKDCSVNSPLTATFGGATCISSSRQDIGHGSNPGWNPSRNPGRTWNSRVEILSSASAVSISSLWQTKYARISYLLHGFSSRRRYQGCHCQADIVGFNIITILVDTNHDHDDKVFSSNGAHLPNMP